MEAKTQHTLKDISPYAHLFPKAVVTEQTVKRNANVADTVKFIPQVVAKTRWQVERFVDTHLQHLSAEEVCKKLWHFVKDHIGYKKDEAGKEQVRSPRRLIHDKIGDCDCFTVFISCCLSLLKEKLKIIHRITKYSADHFQHIYPVVILPNGKQIIMDCVVDNYNFEEPYTQKQDHTMELTYLDGLPEKKYSDAELLLQQEELGKLFDFLKRKTDPVTGEKKETKLKEILKKGLNVINKVNPVTLVLRNGLLAALKLNMMKVSQRLKYAYLSEAEAQKRGVDMAKFAKLKQLREKMEKIFYGAGGKPENLKEAILTGKGNANKEVPLSGFNGHFDNSVIQMNSNTPLEKLLGQEIYYSENMQELKQIEGLEGLGEPVTAASMTAASGVLAAIAALLKGIGNIFPKREKGTEDFENTSDADKEAADASQNTNVDLDTFTLPTEENKTKSLTVTDENSSGETKDTDKDKSPDGEPTFWEKNKKWLKPTIWISSALAALGIGYGVYNSQKGKEEKKEKKEKPVSGVPKKNSQKKNTTKKKAKIKTVTLK